MPLPRPARVAATTASLKHPWTRALLLRTSLVLVLAVATVLAGLTALAYTALAPED